MPLFSAAHLRVTQVSYFLYFNPYWWIQSPNTPKNFVLKLNWDISKYNNELLVHLIVHHYLKVNSNLINPILGLIVKQKWNGKWQYFYLPSEVTVVSVHNKNQRKLDSNKTLLKKKNWHHQRKFEFVSCSNGKANEYLQFCGNSQYIFKTILPPMMDSEKLELRRDYLSCSYTSVHIQLIMIYKLSSHNDTR